MAQCKAATAAGTQCTSDTVAPSRTLCRRHQTVLASGRPVVNFDSGRKFPSPAMAAPAKAKVTTARASSLRSAAPARAPRAVRAAAVAVEDDEPREPRALGEHSLMCDGPRCGNMALPGSNYCMAHQRLA